MKLHARAGNQSGHVLTEFSVSTLLITLPFIAATLLYFKLEWNRTQCSHQTFAKARLKLIQTHQAVHEVRQCGSVTQTIDLVPLEYLDQNKGALGPADGMKEVIQLSEDALRLQSSLSQLRSLAL